MDPNWIVASGTISLAIVSGVQLSNLNKTLKINSLMAVLELETEMSRKKEAYEKAISDLRMLEEAQEQDKEDQDMSGYLKVYNDNIKSSLENYLYSLNRLCYCINNGHISDKDWKSEYRELIFSIVKNNAEYFNVSSKYPNIIDINDKWKRE